MDIFTPLTKADCDVANAGTRAAGPEGADLITVEECNDLARYFVVGAYTARRWFRVPLEPGGTLPLYRRLVPISTAPGRPNDPFAPGRSIASMYPTLDMTPVQRVLIEHLRLRCMLGFALGDPDGITKDALYSGSIGKPFHADFVTLSDCVEFGVNALHEGHWGSGDVGHDPDGHGRFYKNSWFRVRIGYIPLDEQEYGSVWRVTVQFRRRHPIADAGIDSP